jgi:hypothetical protein
MVCVPTVREFVVKDVWPLVRTAVPSVVAPSRKTTDPVAPVGAVAVNITDWPADDGLIDEISVIVGVVFVTVTTVAGDVAELLFASPGVAAVIGSVPTGSVDTVMVAVPFTIDAVPIGVEPS